MQVIELVGDENITAIHNLLEQAAEADVLLFVPRGCKALHKNRINLTLLRRWADNLVLRVGLVVEDRETRGLARDAGFVILPSIEEGQTTNLRLLERKRRRSRLPSRPTLRLPFTQPARKTGRRSALRRYGGPIIAVSSFLLLAMALLFMLPSAVVSLTPVSEPVDAAMEMTGVLGLSEVNYGAAQVPGRTLFVEREGTDVILTTNKRDVPDGYAQGTVVFANRTSVPVTITRGSLVHTVFGEAVRFYTVADVWLPGELHSAVRVNVLAAEPGPGGNVPALTISAVDGELAAQVDVLNDSRIGGGTVRRISSVDGEDKVQLRAKLMKRLQEEAYAELTSALARGEFIPPDSLVLAIQDEAFDHKIDDVTDQLGMTMKVKASGLAVSGADGEKLLLSLLEQRMKPGYRLIPDSASFEQGALIDATPDSARFHMSTRAAIAPHIDPREVRSIIAGKATEAAREILSRRFELASEPQIELRASPLGRLPWWTARIQVQVAAD